MTSFSGGFLQYQCRQQKRKALLFKEWNVADCFGAAGDPKTEGKITSCVFLLS